VGAVGQKPERKASDPANLALENATRMIIEASEVSQLNNCDRFLKCRVHRNPKQTDSVSSLLF